MPMTVPDDKKTAVEVECPCCGAHLQIDTVRGALLAARKPESAARMGAEIHEAPKLLAEESSRIDEKYQQIVAAEKGRSAAMDKLFRNFMEKEKDEPAEKPVRDIDLD
jgi:hypothetical protein